jgi:hypothetical protein
MCGSYLALDELRLQSFESADRRWQEEARDHPLSGDGTRLKLRG